jgi:thiaminase
MIGMLGCGGGAPQPGTPEATLDNIPEWYSNPPQDPNYLFAAATAMSRNMQVSVDKAKQQARTDLASQLEVKVKGITKSFTEEVGMNEESELLTQFTEASKAVVSTVMNGTRVKNQDIKVENGIYRSYVLMELPLGAANAALMQQIRNNENMYTRFRATQAFDELETEVEKYEQFKKEQGMIR